MTDKTQEPSGQSVAIRIVEMLTVANEFCLLLEKSSEHKPEELMITIQRLIPFLYLKGLLLPDTEPSNPELNQHFVTGEQWETVYNDLRAVFGKSDDFRDKPENRDGLPESLSECLADTYQDLKDFVLQFQIKTDTARENAIWDCRLLFRQRWGIRIILAMEHLHRISFPQENGLTPDRE